ncbi:HAD-IA family hydrolase [Pseudaestuariivita sp.]|uniref:HAD-IA family hydrolase n=1 Tax=Pseudaestuariivita sp. TaxID=2211669 RepID=UPI00405A2EC6
MSRASTLLIGSIGVLTESSDLQRQAFNAAFAEHGLDWAWDAEEYKCLLRTQGGRNRIVAYAESRGIGVPADAIYEAKVAAYERLVDTHGLTLRPGIGDLLAEARVAEMKLGFVTATSTRQIALIAGALKEQLSLDIFDYVGNIDRVAEGKPAPDIYHDALDALDVTASDAVAIEDTPESAGAALGAGVRTFVYPGAMAEGRALPEKAELLTTPLDALRAQPLAA